MSGSIQRVETFQQAKERKNRETAGACRRTFAKKATDQQTHINLSKCVDIYLDAFRADPASNNTRAAFRELSLAATLSRQNIKQ